MKYEILMSFGQYKKGMILDSEKPKDNKIIKRKIVETGTLKELSVKENKMDKKIYENKGVKNGNN